MELIRYAYGFRGYGHFHVDPADKELLAESMGVFLAPQSAPVVFYYEDDETPIDDYLEKEGI